MYAIMCSFYQTLHHHWRNPIHAIDSRNDRNMPRPPISWHFQLMTFGSRWQNSYRKAWRHVQCFSKPYVFWWRLVSIDGLLTLRAGIPYSCWYWMFSVKRLTALSAQGKTIELVLKDVCFNYSCARYRHPFTNVRLKNKLFLNIYSSLNIKNITTTFRFLLHCTNVIERFKFRL